MELKLTPAGQYNCERRGEANQYIFEKRGGEIFFRIDKKIPQECRYFAFDIENRQDFSVRVEIRFYKGEVGDTSELYGKSPDFSITTGVLPFISTTAEIPLSYLDGSRLFGERRKGLLKTVVNGNRIDPAEITHVGIHMARCHIEPTLGVGGARFASGPTVQPDFSFDTLIDEFGQWNEKSWKTKTHSHEELKEYLDGELLKAEAFLAGYNDGFYGQGEAIFEATGYFRIEKTEKTPEGGFLMVTPDGREFFGFGCDCVGINITGPLEDGKTHNFLEENLRGVWGEFYYDKWSLLTKYRLIKWGINTIAAWSDLNFAKKSKIPYVTIFNNYPTTKNCVYRDFPDVFSEEYRENSKIYAQALSEFKGDPYLIGYFMSNEPNWAFVWKLNLGYETFISPKTTHSKKKLIEFLRQEYGCIASLNSDFGTQFGDFDEMLNAGLDTKISAEALEELDKFTKILIREYIKVPASALKEVDAHHLNLGIRYAYISNEDLFEGKEFFDVFSINCYDDHCEKAVKNVFEKSQMPVMVGEFHFGALDAGLPATGIRGVASQTERGKAISAYVNSAKNIGCCVGVHYFQLNDQPYLGRFDGENYNIGLVDVCCREYTEVTDIISPISRIPAIFF